MIRSCASRHAGSRPLGRCTALGNDTRRASSNILEAGTEFHVSLTTCSWYSSRSFSSRQKPPPTSLLIFALCLHRLKRGSLLKPVLIRCGMCLHSRQSCLVVWARFMHANEHHFDSRWIRRSTAAVPERGET